VKWSVKYLLWYKDANRWGESVAYGRANAMSWVIAAKKNLDFLEIRVYHGPRLIEEYKRDERNRLQRVWCAV